MKEFKINEDSEEVFYDAKYDTVFKNVVGCEKGKHILKAIIECALGIKLDEITLINTELTKGSVKEQGKTTDCIVTSGNKVINVEVNRSVDQGVKDRNARYIMTKHINQFRVSESYTKVIYSIQINLDWKADYKEYKKEYMIREKSNPNDVYTDKLLIVTFNMKKLLDLWYNKDENFEYKYLAMLAIDNKEKLEKYCKGDKIMEDFKENVIDINDNDIYKDILSKEKDNMMVIEAGLHYAKEEGIEEGRCEEKIEVAKKMLEEDIDIEKIVKVTGLSKEEIKKL